MIRRKNIFEASTRDALSYVMSQLGTVCFTVETDGRYLDDQVEELVDAFKRNADVLAKASDKEIADAFRAGVLSTINELKNGIREY